MPKAFETVAVQRIAGRRVLVLEDGQSLARTKGLSDRYDAVAYEYRGDWHLLKISELGKFKSGSKFTFRAERLSGARTRVKSVPVGTKPSQAAVVVNAAGDIAGAWMAKTSIAKPRKTAAKKAAAKGSGPLLGVRGRGRRRLRGPDLLERAPRLIVSDDGVGVGSAGGGGGGDDGDGPPEATARDAPETNAISRTPHLDAPDEIAKEPGTELTVQVYVDKEDLRAGETGQGIKLDLPDDVDSIQVKVLLQCVGPFELVEGSEVRRLTISRNKDASRKLAFKLRVIDTDEEPGPVAISALFSLRGRACGQVARSWDWAAPGNTALAIEPKAKAPVSMPIYIKAEEPSLSILITAPAGGDTKYKCVVEAPALKHFKGLGKSHDFELPKEAANFRANLLNALTNAGSTPAERFSALQEIGHQTWEAAPEIVKDVLWKMVDDDIAPTTINIATVEPLLPWELMIPRRFNGEGKRKLGPLGVEFAIGRWTRGEVQPPSPYLKVDRSFVIAPTYGKKRKELNFKAELKLIESKLHGERVTPATKAKLNQRFSTDHASLLHFVCHGDAKKEDDAIALDGGELLRAREMETFEGFEDLCQATHPLVFINSCSTGQLVPSLAGGAGFPRSFGNIGAKAIVAPLWAVDDELAGKIALEFYKEGLKKKAKPLAEILQGIRQRGYEEEDADTYAAYCFFGDPHARLELVS